MCGNMRFLLGSRLQWRSKPCALHRASGFSLTEVMVAAAVGTILMTGAVSLIVSHTRTAARSEALMRLQESWSRIQFLLDQEIQEAQETPGMSGCSLELQIPKTTSGYDTVTYARSGNNLMRTGPPVGIDGTITEGGASSSEVVMTGVTAFCPTNDNGEVSYTMTLRDRTGVTYQNQSQPSGARTRSRVIN